MELIIIGKNNKLVNDGGSIEIDGIEIKSKSSVKYLGDFIDKHLSYQDEVKKILQKKAYGIQTITAVQKSFNLETGKVLF